MQKRAGSEVAGDVGKWKPGPEARYPELDWDWEPQMEGMRPIEVGGGAPKRSRGGDGGPKELAGIDGGETEKESKWFKSCRPGESMTMVSLASGSGIVTLVTKNNQ